MGIRMLFLCLTLVLIIGCQQKNMQDTSRNKDSNEPFIQVKDSKSEKNEHLDREQIAERLANIAAKVPNVNNSTAIVAGPYAVVGIDVDKELDRSRVGTIKYSVSEALHHDTFGKTAVVIADADVMERIQGMKDKIKDGHPIQGIVDELASIVGRYMPDFPIDEDQPQDPDQNKEIISDEEKEQLEEIENDQSKE